MNPDGCVPPRGAGAGNRRRFNDLDEPICSQPVSPFHRGMRTAGNRRSIFSPDYKGFLPPYQIRVVRRFGDFGSGRDQNGPIRPDAGHEVERRIPKYHSVLRRPHWPERHSKQEGWRRGSPPFNCPHQSTRVLRQAGNQQLIPAINPPASIRTQLHPAPCWG